MAWTNLTFSFGAILTSQQMTQLDNNFEALAAADTGAPKIQTGALEQTGGSEAVTQATVRDSAIGRSQLKTSTVSTTVVVSGGGNGVYYTTNSRAFFPHVYAPAYSGAHIGYSTDRGTPDAWQLRFNNTDKLSATIHIDYRYVTS